MSTLDEGSGIAAYILLGTILRRLVERRLLRAEDVSAAVADALADVQRHEPGVAPRHRASWKAATVVLEKTLKPMTLAMGVVH